MMTATDREDPNRKPRLGKLTPLSGAWYWFPSPSEDGIRWTVMTCHDLGIWDGISHREFWPWILENLATVWGKDAENLKHHLRDHYTGLPRGRIVRPKSDYIVIHGDDAPVPDWLDLVKSRFQLLGVEVTSEFTEHEKMLGNDPQELQIALGVSLSLKANA